MFDCDLGLTKIHSKTGRPFQNDCKRKSLSLMCQGLRRYLGAVSGGFKNKSSKRVFNFTAGCQCVNGSLVPSPRLADR